MKKIVVIGGGLSGLSSAVHLVNNNFKVILIEGSPKLGGRAYSYFDPKTLTEIDNGQHIMMSCYHDTLELLNIIDAQNEIKIQKQLKVNFVGIGNQQFSLAAKNIFYPLDLLLGFLSFKVLSIRERLKVIDLFLDLMCCFEEDLEDLTVEEWLRNKNQSQKAIKNFWGILCVGIMNTKVGTASAELFAFVIKEIFLSGKKNTRIIVPRSGLSKVFAEKAEKFIIENSSEILKSERVINISRNDDSLIITTQSGMIINADFVITSVPHFALIKILDNALKGNLVDIRLEYSPILSVHLWLKNNFFNEDFYGLIDSKIQWIFNHDSFITIVISAADEFVSKSEKEILCEIIYELNKFFPMFSEDLVLNFRVIKEKRATFVPNISALVTRKRISRNMQNLFIAGDWTNTGLPGTIEGAVKSGKLAAFDLIAQA